MRPLALALLLALPLPAQGWTLALLPVEGGILLRLDAAGSAFLCDEGSGQVELWLARAASAHAPGAALTATLGAGARTREVPAMVVRDTGFDGIRAEMAADDPFWQALFSAPVLGVTLPGLARWTLPLTDFATPGAGFLAACRG